MKELFFDVHTLPDRVTDWRFLELEIQRWLKSRTRRQQLEAERYYDGRQKILKVKREAVDEYGKLQEVKFLPNNKIVDNRYVKMVDQITNFETGQPFTFDTDMTAEGSEAYAKELTRVFGKGALRTFRRLTKHAVNEGIAWLYVWPQEEELRFSVFPASEVLPFWKDAEHTELDCAVHFYSIYEYDANENKSIVHHVEVFHGGGIDRFIWENNTLKNDFNTSPSPYLTVEADGKTQGYNWTRCPLIPFKFNDSEEPLLNRCKCLQDALNTILSIFMNRMEEDVHNTILILKNYDGEDLAEFRRNLMLYGVVKVSSYDGGDGGLETLTVEVNAQNYELIVKLLQKAIIENCGGFDAKDERMSGNPNQMNIQSMYADIEITANGLETEFQAAFEQLLWFVCQHLKQTGKGDFERIRADVVFNRDMMVNESEVIKNCKESLGLISLETILNNHSWVKNAAEEKERIKKEEEEARQSDPYASAFIGGRTDPARGVTGDGAE